MKIKIVIADDHEIYREGLQSLLAGIDNVELLGFASDGNTLVKLVKQVMPDIVLTDIKMPNMNGIEATKYLTKYYNTIGVIALSMYEEAAQIIEFLEAGGKGYLLKDASIKEISEAIETVAQNKNYYCTHTTKAISNYLTTIKTDNAEQITTFKDIELQIIELVCQGLTSKEIGDIVYLSPRTIEGYKIKIQNKIGAKNSAGIIIYAIKNGLIK